MNNTPQMKIIRNKIDIIDNKLLPLMVKRSKLVEKALELKIKRTEIVDRERIREITKKLHKRQKSLTVIQNY